MASVCGAMDSMLLLLSTTVPLWSVESRDRFFCDAAMPILYEERRALRTVQY